MATYRGLTWDHPRGRTALEQAAEGLRSKGSGLELTWDVHSLEGFESSPIHRLAEKYDLIVLDHPHLGEALQHGSLRPLDEVFDAHDIDQWAAEMVGSTLDSYVYDGRLWALPLDAAAQVAALRRDLVGDDVPHTWDEVDALADRRRTALCLAGPHAFLTFASLCVALGEEPARGGSEHTVVSRAVSMEAIRRLKRLADRAPAGSDELNPIALLEVMSTSDSIEYCPLVFGYVNYAMGTSGSRLLFTDAPAQTPGGRPGSTLGGTGLALTRRSEPSPGLLRHLRWLLNATTQRQFIPLHKGQPSARAAWQDPTVNRHSNNFYRGTIQTIEESWIRPRYPGYIAFQGTASATIRAILRGAVGSRDGLDRLDQLYSASVRSQADLSKPAHEKWLSHDRPTH